MNELMDLEFCKVAIFMAIADTLAVIAIQRAPDSAQIRSITKISAIMHEAVDGVMTLEDQPVPEAQA